MPVPGTKDADGYWQYLAFPPREKRWNIPAYCYTLESARKHLTVSEEQLAKRPDWAKTFKPVEVHDD